MKKLNIGILASVDSGKTTLSEAMLYMTGAIKTQGKIENKNTLLDHNEIERLRGITVFSKTARFEYEDVSMVLVDTPGHVDFTYESEMVLNILDAAILLISAADGVTGHTKQLWELLSEYNIPTFIFINKLDRIELNRDDIIKDIKEKLSSDIIVFENEESDNTYESIYEQAIYYDDELYEKYVSEDKIEDIDISALIMERVAYPVFYGSAIKGLGVEKLLSGLALYVAEKKYADEFGGFVYKISRDGKDRLTNMLITGGTLKVRDSIDDEKVHEIRVYNGSNYICVDKAEAGMIVSVTGLSKTRAGYGIGANEEACVPLTEPVLSYSVWAVNNDNSSEVLDKLNILDEENPGLSVSWDEIAKEIKIKLLGNIQQEVLKSEALRRFGLEIEFGEEEIIYKETVKDIVMGVGHFEPLRHYAEVCLVISPLKRDSGIIFNNVCNRENLPINWQKLIMSHLEEKEHKGVLAGCGLTDICITLVDGRSHLKHTEGGDFREATYRAVRQGLMNAHNLLLEPLFNFTIMSPRDNIGRIMTDVEKMYGTCNISEGDGEIVMITGRGPVATFKNYQSELREITHGKGSITCVFAGYDICHNEEEVINSIKYNPDEDLDNPSGSIFCSHGAGVFVDWSEVYDKMHVSKDAFNIYKNFLLGGETDIDREETLASDETIISEAKEEAKRRQLEFKNKEKELARIFADTYGGVSADENIFHTTMSNERLKGRVNGRRKITVNGKARGDKPYIYNPVVRKKKLLIVDGYNVIFALDKYKDIAKENIDGARDELIDSLIYYGGAENIEIILVFDAYKVKEGVIREEEYKGITVTFTGENQTADTFIEQMAEKLGRKRDVYVVSSDSLIRVTARSFGCMVMSSREFGNELIRIKNKMSQKIDDLNQDEKTYLFDNVSEDVKKILDELRNK